MIACDVRPAAEVTDMGTLTFGSAMVAFILSSIQVLSQPDLRRWYFRIVKRCFLVALLVLVTLLFGGAWVISSMGQGPWSQVGAVLWVICLLFLSGKLTVSILGLLMGNVVDERALLSAFLGVKIVSLKNPAWGDLRGEYWASLRGVFLSLIAWPLFLIPFLIPFGILIFGWSMGKEALASAHRICHQNGESTILDKGPVSNSFALGLGIIPAAASIIPVVGWAFWPLLVASGVYVCRAGTVRIQKRS